MRAFMVTNTDALQHPPWRRPLASGIVHVEVTVVRRRRIGACATRAVGVQHLGSLPVWERKARDVTVTPTGPHHGPTQPAVGSPA
jgi:hypothetical protein